jgi:hypothetical protein
METFIGIFALQDLCIIGRWKWSLISFELYSQRVGQGGEDKMSWIPFKRKSFEVKCYYQVLSTLVNSPFL